MKKKIGVATFTGQWPLNYGSALQTTALQWLLKEYGYDVESVTIYLGAPFRRFHRINRFYDRWNVLGKEWVKTFFSFRSFFKKNKIKLGGKSGEYPSDIYASKHATRYDILCCGSDAIWKRMYIRPFFLWDYDSVHIKPRFSYAASMLTGEFNTLHIAALNRFDGISVREEKTRDILSDFTEKEISVVLDPTLTIDEEYWNRAASRRCISEPYLLCYILDTPEKHYINVKDIARKHGISRIVFINTDFIDKAVRSFSYYHGEDYKGTVGPSRFLSLFKYADVICTDSFHGVCFSIVFRHQFYILIRDDLGIDNEKTYDYRLTDLLKRLSLGDRFVKRNADINAVKDICWDEVETSLKSERERSREYLSGILKTCNDKV